MPNVTLTEFISGEPLEYRGFDRSRRLRATYQLGVGVTITDAKGRELGVAETVLDDAAARRVYHNLVRNTGGRA